MKWYVIKSANGNVEVASEWNNLNSAKVAYHDLCKVFWNSPDVLDGVIAIVDSHLELVEPYKEYIHHEAS